MKLDKPLIIGGGLPEIPNAFIESPSDINFTDIPSLSEALRGKTHRVLVLDWSKGYTALRRDRSQYLVTSSLQRALQEIEKTLTKCRKNKIIGIEKIPLIVVSRWFEEKNFTGTMFEDWQKALFLAKRIAYGRSDNQREIVYLTKNKSDIGKLEAMWREYRRRYTEAKYVQIRVETQLEDILGPIEAGEYPEIIRLHASMHAKIYVGKRELESFEDPEIHFRKRKGRGKKISHIVPKIEDSDESVIQMLRRLTHRQTQISLFGRFAYPESSIDICHLDIDVPRLIKKCHLI